LGERGGGTTSSSSGWLLPQSLSCVENLELWFWVLRWRRGLEKVLWVKGAASSTKGTQRSWLDLEIDRRVEWLCFIEWGEWDKLNVRLILETLFSPSGRAISNCLPHSCSVLNSVIQIRLLEIVYIIPQYLHCSFSFFCLRLVRMPLLLLCCNSPEKSFHGAIIG
jgi:hypothetical protein